MTPSADRGVCLSVALVTRNRPASLERCLASWGAQEPRPDEILVSDDSDDAHVEAVRTVCARHGARHQRGPRRGLYANRNAAALACTGTHILSADDDHTHPPGLVAACLRLAARDPRRVWTFAERDPARPDGTLDCPPMLDRSGHGAPPPDPSDSSGLGDGSTLYPRAIFDGGLRYDDTYRFGALWYLWALRLRRAGWRITFSTDAFVWHHGETDGRLADPEALRNQLEVMTYALFVRAFWIHPGPASWFWAAAYTARRIVRPDGVVHYAATARLPPGRALRALRRARSARGFYRP